MTIPQQSATVMFRGNPVEVVFEDHGYEPDDGGHTIDWWFADEIMNEKVLVTDDEEQVVYDQLLDISQGLGCGLDAEENYPPVGTPETALVFTLTEDNYAVVAHTGRYFHGAINCAGYSGEELGLTDVPADAGVWVFEGGVVYQSYDEMGHADSTMVDGDWRRAKPADFERFGYPCPLDLGDLGK